MALNLFYAYNILKLSYFEHPYEQAKKLKLTQFMSAVTSEQHIFTFQENETIYSLKLSRSDSSPKTCNFLFKNRSLDTKFSGVFQGIHQVIAKNTILFHYSRRLDYDLLEDRMMVGSLIQTEQPVVLNYEETYSMLVEVSRDLVVNFLFGREKTSDEDLFLFAASFL